jgi:hypothetical protein
VVCLPFIDDFPIQTSMPGKPRFMTSEGNGFMDTQLGLPENGPNISHGSKHHFLH